MRDKNDNTDATLEEGVPVVEGEEQAPIERPKSPRELAMEAIEEQSTRQRAEELGIDLSGEEPPEAETARQIEAQMADEVISDPGSRKVRIKVDGQEQDVELSEVLRNYQKGSAADKRLEEATRLLKEAQQQAQAREQAAPETGTEQAPESLSVASPEDIESQLDLALESLYAGDRDATRKALAQVISQGRGGAQPTPAPALDIGEVTTRVQQRLAVDTAIETVRKDYPDVIANSDLELLAAIKVNAKEAEGIPRSQAILDAAKEVYESLGKTPAGRPQDVQGESRDEKLKQKAARDRLPTASAAANQVPENADPVDPSALIRQIAGRRLGQSLVFGT